MAAYDDRPMTGPRKPRKASWRELPPAEMAAHLLATPTIADGLWTSEPRLPREKRSDFVRRVLLGETPEPEPETPEAEAAELADQKCYLLNTDGGNSGNPLGRAAIGALLMQGDTRLADLPRRWRATPIACLRQCDRC